MRAVVGASRFTQQTRAEGQQHRQDERRGDGPGADLGTWCEQGNDERHVADRDDNQQTSSPALNATSPPASCVNLMIIGAPAADATRTRPIGVRRVQS